MATGTWIFDGSDNWSNSARWSGGTVADGATFTANFTNNISATRTVTVDTVRTIGNITFSDNGAAGSAWVLSGANALTLDNGGSAPVLNVITGTTISGPITGTAGFTKDGAGTLTIANATPATNTLTGTLTINAGGATEPPSVKYGNGTYNTNVASTVSSAQLADADVVINANTTLQLAAVNPAINATPTFTGDYSGDGNIWAWSATITGTTSWVARFTGSLTNLGSPSSKRSGIYFANNQNAPRGIVSAVTVPRNISFFNGAGGATPNFLQSFEVESGAAGATYPTKIHIFSWGSAAVLLPTNSQRFLANQNNGNGPIVLTGGVERTDDATGDADTSTLTLGGTNTEDNTLSGTIASTAGSGPLAISKIGTGRWVLSGPSSTYTGGVRISAGTLSAQNNSAFGSSLFGAVTQTGGTIDISGNTTLNKGTVAANTVGVSGSTALTSTSGNNEWIIGAVAMNSTTIVDIAAGARLKLNNSGALSGVGFGITKNGTGEFELANTDNTFTGAVTVAAGTLTVTKLANSGAGSTSSIGTGAATPAIALTGTLKYAGTAPAGHSTNRSITFTGAAPALDASGTGAVTYSAATQAEGARTITFTGSSTAANTLSAALSDGTGAVSVAKSGAGKWVLSNATVNYTGTTTISDGTLDVSGANRTLTGGVSISGGTLASTNTVEANTTMTGGTVTAELTGNKTLDVNSGSAATLQPTNNANTFSGATTVAAGGILRLITGANPTTAGAGLVLGTSAVSVSGDIKTGATGAQRGQMRYGGNLTFNTGAKLYVGGA